MNKIFALLLLLCGNLFAAQIAPNPDFQYTFDRLQGFPSARKYLLGTLLREAHTTAVCVYDFATQGGAVGQINLLAQDLKTPCLLPGKAVIRSGMVDVSITPAGAGAQVAISSGRLSGDMRTATGIGTFAAPGELAVSPQFATVSGYIKLTTANSIVNGVNLNAYQPYVSVSGATLTAGHFRVFFDYVVGE